MPAQDDWLKERSSTPPVSSTMQALNAFAELPDPPPLPEPPDPPLPPLPLVEGLEPHPASSRLAAPRAAAILMA